MNPRRLKASLAVSISYGTAVMGISKILHFLLKLFVSRLGVSDFGDYYLATATFTGLASVAALGIPMSTTRFVSYYTAKRMPERVKGIVSSALIVTFLSSVVCATLLFIFALPISNVIGAPAASVSFRILAAGLIGATTTMLSRAVYIGRLQINRAYVADTIEITCKFALTAIGMITLGWGVVGAIVGFAAGTFLSAIINGAMMLSSTGIRQLRPSAARNFIDYAWPVGASELLTVASNVILLYIVRTRGGADTIGLYAAAVSVASLLHVLPQMMFSIFLPSASRLYAEGRKVAPIYKTLLAWTSVAVFIPSAILLLLRYPLLTRLFGMGYDRAVPMLTTLIAAYAVYALVVWPNRQLLDMAGYTKANLMLTILRITVSGVVLIGFSTQYAGTGLANAVLAGWAAEGLGSVALVIFRKILSKQSSAPV